MIYTVAIAGTLIGWMAGSLIRLALMIRRDGLQLNRWNFPRPF